MAGDAIPRCPVPLGEREPHTHPQPPCFHLHSSQLACKFLLWLLDTGLESLQHEE